MKKKFKKWFKERVNTKDDLVAQWYWRKKYNTLLGEFELLKEVMRDEVYNKTIRTITQPLELAGCKRTIKRLNDILFVTKEERNNLIIENKELRKFIKEQDALKIGQKDISYNNIKEEL